MQAIQVLLFAVSVIGISVLNGASSDPSQSVRNDGDDEANSLPQWPDRASFLERLPDEPQYTLVEFQTTTCRMCRLYKPTIARIHKFLEADKELVKQHMAIDEQQQQKQDANQVETGQSKTCNQGKSCYISGRYKKGGLGSMLKATGDHVSEAEKSLGGQSQMSMVQYEELGINYHRNHQEPLLHVATNRSTPMVDEEWNFAGRFRNMSLYVFNCQYDEPYCIDLDIETVPILRLYYGKTLLAEQNELVRAHINIAWIKDVFAAHDQYLKHQNAQQ